MSDSKLTNISTSVHAGGNLFSQCALLSLITWCLKRFSFSTPCVNLCQTVWPQETCKITSEHSKHNIRWRKQLLETQSRVTNYRKNKDRRMHSSPQHVGKKTIRWFKTAFPELSLFRLRDLRPERTIVTTLSNIPQNRPANCCEDYRLRNLKDTQFSFTRRKLLSICTTDNITLKRNKNKNCMLFLVHGCLTDSILMPLASSPVRWSKNNKTRLS